MNKLQQLRAQFKKLAINGFIIPSNDEFMSEYTPEHLNRLKYITGFTGSNGVAIVLEKGGIFFTDGRYLLQASKELPNDFKILDMYEKSSCNTMGRDIGKNKVIGYDPMLHSEPNLKYYERLAAEHQFKLTPLKNNPIQVDITPPKSTAYLLSDKLAGEKSSAKIKRVIERMDKKATHLLIAAPDSICWLLNMRGDDVAYSPLVQCYAVIGRKGDVRVYGHFQKNKSMKFEVAPLDQIHADLGALNKKKGACLQYDANKTPVGLVQGINDKITASDAAEAFKCVKNATECANIKKYHEYDGVAVTKLLYWLHNSKKSLDELQVSEKLLELRKQQPNFVYPSFPTIAAYGSNASIIHYKPNASSNKKIGKNNFFLLDSGGQYLGATTDITRTVMLGQPTALQKRLFTLVLMGHIDLAMAHFPKGTTGAHLDALARAHLWREGLDYAHGTGHGVGYFLSVHEGPVRIAKSTGLAYPFAENMLVSNEPGYYKNGKFGIRIENLIMSKSAKNNFLAFETVTLAPFQGSLIDSSLLSKAELKWLETYQSTVFKKLSKHLSKAEQAWLKKYMEIA